MKDFSEKIKFSRKAAGLSQVVMAAKIGISQAAYGKIESGFTKSISIEVGIGIAKALNYNFGQLFEIEGYDFEPSEREAHIKVLEDSEKDLDERLKERKLTIDLLVKSIEIYKRAIYELLVMHSQGRISIYNEKIKNEPSKEKLLELEKKKIILERLEKKYLEAYIYLGLLTESDIEQFKANPDFMTISKFNIDGLLKETT